MPEGKTKIGEKVEVTVEQCSEPECLQFPVTSFIWIMGADNLIQFFQWKDPHRIAKLVDIFVMHRPDFTFKALSSKSVSILGSRCPPSHLGTGRKRKWAFSFSTRNTLSATKIRKNMPNL